MKNIIGIKIDPEYLKLVKLFKELAKKDINQTQSIIKWLSANLNKFITVERMDK
jgi:hypothetical protein